MFQRNHWKKIVRIKSIKYYCDMKLSDSRLRKERREQGRKRGRGLRPNTKTKIEKEIEIERMTGRGRKKGREIVSTE